MTLSTKLIENLCDTFPLISDERVTLFTLVPDALCTALNSRDENATGYKDAKEDVQVEILWFNKLDHLSD